MKVYRDAGWISARVGTGLNGLRDRIVREWLGPPEGEALSPAPFTKNQIETIGKASSASSIDDMLSILVQCSANLCENGRP